MSEECGRIARDIGPIMRQILLGEKGADVINAALRSYEYFPEEIKPIKCKRNPWK